MLGIVPLITRAISAEVRHRTHPSHFHLLAMLSHRTRNLSELAELHGVSLPSMSSTIRTLEERGWVRRVPSEQDRRVVMIELTSGGRAVLAEIQRRSEDRLAGVLEGLSPEELETVLAGLELLEAAFTFREEAGCASPILENITEGAD